MIVSCNIVFGQKDEIKFSHLSMEQGLSQTLVSCITQDHYGFMWFGTYDGLDRYDGYNVKIYRHERNNLTTISDNTIRSLYEDKNGYLWIGTQFGGLVRYDIAKDSFAFYHPKKDEKMSTNAENISCLFEDSKGRFWVGTFDGLFLLDKSTGIFTKLPILSNKIAGISGSQIKCITEDIYGNIWVGTLNGLNKIEGGTNTITNFFSDAKKPHTLTYNDVTALMADKTGKIWIGTSKDALNIFDQTTGNFSRYTMKDNDADLVADLNINSIIEDSQKNIWIATFGDALFLLPASQRKQMKFLHYKNDEYNQYSISANHLMAAYQDRSGILWIGNFDKGLDKFDVVKGNKFFHYRKQRDQENSLASESVTAILVDDEQNLWVGNSGKGMCVSKWSYNSDLSFKNFKHNPKDKFSIGDNAIYQAIVVDIKGDKQVWIATLHGGISVMKKENFKKGKFIVYQNDKKNSTSLATNRTTFLLDDIDKVWIATKGRGLAWYDKETGKFGYKYIKQGKNISFNSNSLSTIIKDTPSALWIGTESTGFSHYNKLTGEIISYESNDDPNSLINNATNCLYKDTNGRLWIGTQGGLDVMTYNPKNLHEYKFKSYTVKDGLANDYIWGILEDKNGHIWVSTNHGLSEIDTKNNTIKNYDISDGLQNNEYNFNSFFKNEDGLLFFGGVSGFNVFHPDSIKINQLKPEILITDFLVFNKSVKIGENKILNKQIFASKQIDLDYKYNSFSFEFTAAHYSNPSKNIYKYKLDGIDKEWNYTDVKRRFASYTNLMQGTYTFYVNAANADGVWNDKAESIKIKIIPPFYLTSWFYTIISCTLLLWLLLYIKNREQHLKLEKTHLEQEVIARTKEIEKQKNEILQKSLELSSMVEELKVSQDIIEDYNKELEKLSIVASNTDNAVIIMNAKGDFEWVNESYTILFGFTLKQLICEKSNNIIGPTTPENIKELIYDCIQNKKTVSYEQLIESRKNKKVWVQVTMTPILGDNNEIKKIICIDSDITKIKEAEKAVKDSINYASHIQNAIMPPASLISQIFDEYFVLFLPRDIVSGDFYWVTQKNDKTIVAVGDCTGHGVPAAFMSMLGITFLNEIVSKNSLTQSDSFEMQSNTDINASEILNELRTLVIKSLHQTGTLGEPQDGMDLALCVIDFDNLTIQFAGANSPAYIVRANNNLTNESEKFLMLKADKMPIAMHLYSMGDFTNQTIDFKSGDYLYLFSDGYKDQFGGPKMRKFYSNNFQQLLVDNAHFSAEDQREILYNTLRNWKGKLDQVDDILVMGIRL